MPKLIATFRLYEGEIGEQLRKSIRDKLAKQIARCVLSDMAGTAGQAEAAKDGEGEHTA